MKNIVQNISHFIRRIGAMIHTPPAPRPSVHCNNINMLLMHLCDFDNKQYLYVVKWLAFQLKNPGSKMCYGIIVKGDQGTGKNMFFQHVAIPLFEGMGRIVHADALSGRFSNWVGAPLVVVDGHITERTLARIKALMTSKSVIIDRQGHSPREIQNTMNFILLAGDVASAPTFAERRFMVLEAPPAREKVFYQAIGEEIRNGGVDAFREFLMRDVYLAGFNETTQPPGIDRVNPGECAALEAA